ncbi:valyl-tRNA synthetase [Sphaeroforma arctica JP610]|uniref:valine--tRNA ligase n=1 Tax=Sphaeroforma arctica JP610 TaxID=667725 RepID=A0A0L0GB01_9EUKA|nr:valyl-tRNA synthetase [Sphaeroforma arctica JP610]KNC86197.1 valyl-tRNA synthetase [Sphaeroforma arctica JP610]|eukprot:XP_014160099.1 valyl-tRNA synthetase [Sphaeroforma arctica JP610]
MKFTRRLIDVSYKRCDTLHARSENLLVLRTIRACYHRDPSQPLPSAYNSSAVEEGTYKWWEETGIFKPRKVGTNTSTNTECSEFSMLLPPPNVTGSLHIGHALTGSVQDAIVRWKRMGASSTPSYRDWNRAYNTVVHVGIGRKTRLKFSNSRRIQIQSRVFEWKELYGSTIHNQHRRLGLSLDWSREYFTLDPHHSSLVKDTFVKMYDDGIIYRDMRMCNWCVRLQTVISDIEVDSKVIEGRGRVSVPRSSDQAGASEGLREVEVGVMHDFAYKLAGSDSAKNGGLDELVVSTTRIETMLGDVAVAVHPDDKRYKHLHGRHVVHPFTGEQLPIVLDEELVDMDKGTGAVKITPAHDFNDYACGVKHGLTLERNVLDRDGKIVKNLLDSAGLKCSDRFDAREEIIQILKDKDLYRGSKDHAMVLPLCSRSGDIIEPMLLPQWYVKAESLQKIAREVVASGMTKISPSRYEKDWFRWVDDMDEWCISRQLWWGHRIPAYRVIGNQQQELGWVAASTEAEAHRKVQSGSVRLSTGSFTDVESSADHSLPQYTLVQDEDVLDTWFSSGLIPLSVTSRQGDQDVSYPTDVLETGSDILFFWVARMVMLCKYSTGESPFKDIYLHPMVRDAQGRKMSKSLGNVIDPVDVINGQTLSNLIDRVQTSNLPATERANTIESLNKGYSEGIPGCGADALRFTLCEYMQQGSSIKMSVERVQHNAKFCNKIWQLVRFYDSRRQKKDQNSDTSVVGIPALQAIQQSISEAQLPEQWILSRTANTVKDCNKALDEYNLGAATQSLMRFVWFDLCDVYLETLKLSQNDPGTFEGQNASTSSVAVLNVCIVNSLKLLHPFMPYITEELWQHVAFVHGTDHSGIAGKCGFESISLQTYPITTEFEAFVSPTAEADMALSMAIVKAIRDMRQSFQLSPKIQIPVTLSCSSDVVDSVKSNGSFVSDMSNITIRGIELSTTNQADSVGKLVRLPVNEACWIDVDLQDLPQDFTKLIKKLQGQLHGVNKKIMKLEKAVGAGSAAGKMPAHIFEAKSIELDGLKEQRIEIEATLRVTSGTN